MTVKPEREQFGHAIPNFPACGEAVLTRYNRLIPTIGRRGLHHSALDPKATTAPGEKTMLRCSKKSELYIRAVRFLLIRN